MVTTQVKRLAFSCQGFVIIHPPTVPSPSHSAQLATQCDLYTQSPFPHSAMSPTLAPVPVLPEIKITSSRDLLPRSLPLITGTSFS